MERSQAKRERLVLARGSKQGLPSHEEIGGDFVRMQRSHRKRGLSSHEETNAGSVRTEQSKGLSSHEEASGGLCADGVEGACPHKRKQVGLTSHEKTGRGLRSHQTQ